MTIRHCAVYTRKSSEEGLEQEFNSLHAQREACESYIKSQKHEGWQLVKAAYDDGGLSGGNMERPALQQLLADIQNRKVDIVVVYKVDRLTRSLADFAKIVELFDKHGVSFVSVTQQFNTTSSMGRLTLNVLLSFAQFEREVTGERIRDKIAASKAKGIWMGGPLPLGYDVKERKLIINHAEAETVRFIFTRYLELGRVRLLQADLKNQGIRSKPTEKYSTGNFMSRGALYKLLSNPMYIGQIRHKETCYPGQHEAIIDRALWDQVRQLMDNNTVPPSGNKRKTAPSPLIGKLFDELGEPLGPSHATKHGRRYRYYVSRHLLTGVVDKDKLDWRLPAQELEMAVADSARSILDDQTAIMDALRKAGTVARHVPAALNAIKKASRELKSGLESLSGMIERVDLRQDGLRITLSLASLMPVENKPPVSITRDIPMQMKRRGIEMRLVIENGIGKPDATLVKAVACAHSWFEELVSGRGITLTTIAAREGLDKSHVSRMLNLAFLAPSIIENIMAGSQPANLTVETLAKRTNLPLDWAEQKRLLS